MAGRRVETRKRGNGFLCVGPAHCASRRCTADAHRPCPVVRSLRTIRRPRRRWRRIPCIFASRETRLRAYGARSCGLARHRPARGRRPGSGRRALSNAISLPPRVREKGVVVARPAPVAPGRRPVVYDMSHLIARLRAETGTGIDRIDLAFASHFFSSTPKCEAVRYGSGPPRRIGGSWAREFTRAAQNVWTKAETARAEALWAWLEAPPGSSPKPRLVAPVPKRRAGLEPPAVVLDGLSRRRREQGRAAACGLYQRRLPSVRASALLRMAGRASRRRRRVHGP